MILRGGVLRCVILIMEMILGGDSYEKSCWKWSGRHSDTPVWVWDMTMVILGVILRGDPKGGICDSYDGNDSGR